MGAGSQDEKLSVKQGRARESVAADLYLLLEISKLHSPCDLKKKLVTFTMELHVPLTRNSELRKLKKVCWELEHCRLAAAPRQPTELGDQAAAAPLPTSSELDGCCFTSNFHISWKYLPWSKLTCKPVRKEILGNVVPAKPNWHSSTKLLHWSRP